jgi:hypothetical protein
VASEGTPPEGINLPVSWIDFHETPIAFSNQAIVQHQPNEFVVTFGQATPPPLIGTPEQVQRQAAEISFVPIRTLARLGMNRERLVELIAALQANLDNHDRSMRASDPTSK